MCHRCSKKKEIKKDFLKESRTWIQIEKEVGRKGV